MTFFFQKSCSRLVLQAKTHYSVDVLLFIAAKEKNLFCKWQELILQKTFSAGNDDDRHCNKEKKGRPNIDKHLFAKRVKFTHS